MADVKISEVGDSTGHAARGIFDMDRCRPSDGDRCTRRSPWRGAESIPHTSGDSGRSTRCIAWALSRSLYIREAIRGDTIHGAATPARVRREAPWYSTRLIRGRGVMAAKRSSNSSGSKTRRWVPSVQTVFRVGAEGVHGAHGGDAPLSRGGESPGRHLVRGTVREFRVWWRRRCVRCKASVLRSCSRRLP